MSAKTLASQAKSAREDQLASTPAAQLLQADSLEAEVLADQSVDLVVTSPPYNVGKPYNGCETDDSLTYGESEKF